MITAVIIICIVLLIMYSCDDRIRVEGDLQPMVSVPFIGYSERENDFEEEIQKSIEHLASKVSDSENGDLSDGDAGIASSAAKPTYVSADVDDSDYEALSGKACVVTVVFGKTTVQMLCNVLAKLSIYDCEVLGVVIAKADRKFLCRYFGRVKA